MITMTEIARQTGVSQPTVSRVLNGNTAVHPDIRERVLACARENGFQPNILAQSLAGSKTHLIGVILTDISNPFFADLVKYLEQEARSSGYSLILFNSQYDSAKEEECLQIIQRYRVDGLIVVPVDENAPRWQALSEKAALPAVVITRRIPSLDSVYVSHEEAGALVAVHLYEQGYRSYLFFGMPEDEKYLGFARALSMRDPAFESRLTILHSKDNDVLLPRLREHFATAQAPTGIFAYNDRRALQLMGLLKQLHIPIPGQAGLIGFDNTYMCEYLYPRLSSVSQPNETMAVTAMKRLLERIGNPGGREVRHCPLSASLVCRESSHRKDI